MFLVCRFASMAVTGRPHAIAFTAAAVLLIATVEADARDGSKDWTVLQNCRLIANPANDGDSFHVRADTSEYIFRLYMVDAPETDEMIPGRLIKQAKYFSIRVPQAIEVGVAAKEFTREKLSESFTVFTRMSDAMGHSRLERFYAFVETKNGDLGEQLVRNGLARTYGFNAVPPGLRNSRLELEKLRQFEREAEQERIGGWGVNAGRLSARAQKPAAFSVFTAETTARPHALRMTNAFPRTFATPVLRSSTKAAGSVAGRQSHAKKEIEIGRIDVNTSTEKELKMIPGVGPVIASRIIAARPFRSADDLRKVSGIGEKKYAEIRPYFQ